MSAKELKPTLGGTRIKTRKRNINVPLDPGSFADAVAQIFVDAKDDPSPLEAGLKALEVTELDFSRYGDTLFECIFTGGRLAHGAAGAEDAVKMPQYVLSTDGSRERILEFIVLMHNLIRRRPFLIKNLENTLKRLIQSLEHYLPEDREKIACSTSRILVGKLGVLPDSVFLAMQIDSMVAKGSILDFLTAMFKDYLSDTSLEDLMLLLRKAKMDDHECLLMLFPSQKRSNEDFAAHFSAAGLKSLVDLFNKRMYEVKLRGLKEDLTEKIAEGAEIADVLKIVEETKAAASLPDAELIPVCWNGVMDAVQWSGKNQQQNVNMALRQVKAWSKLFAAFCPSAKVELVLINSIQVTCYEDTKLMKLFAEIVRTLYQDDVVSEDAVLYWYRKGTNTKGRAVFAKDMEPFIKWLEEAEEEDEDED